MSSSVNPGNDYKGRLGCKTKCYQHVYCWVFSDNYIQQLLKGKDGIVDTLIELEYLASGVLLLACECDVVLNL